MVLRILWILVFTAAIMQGQVPATSKTVKKKALDGQTLLKQVDKRIYYACENGLKSMRFRMSMDHGTGVFRESMKGLYVAVAWKAPNHWRVDIVDAKGQPSTQLDAFLATKDGKAVVSAWQTEIKGMALHLIIGLPLHKKYASHLKKVKSRTVNNKIEHTITMHPPRKGAYSEAILRIVNGIPRELVHITSKGERFISRFRFKKKKEFGNKWLWTGVEQEIQHRKTREELYEYLTRKKLLMLSKLERLDYVGPQAKIDFKVEALEVNPKFPPGFFKKPG